MQTKNTILLLNKTINKKTVLLLAIFLVSIYNIKGQIKNDIYSIPIDSLWNMKVSGVSRFKQSADKTPNSLLVITEKQIELRGYQDLSDVLKDIPGFDITDNASRYGEYYTLRGIQGNERFLVLIDGHKLNPPTGTLLSIGNSISVRFAKQIEIIYGPASAVYGADAYSGIINIISKDSYKNNVNTVVSGSYASLSSIDAMIENRVKVNDDLSLTIFGRMFRSDGFDVVGTDSIYNIIKRYKPPYKPECEQPINDFTVFFKANYKKLTFGYFRQMFDEGNCYTQNPDKNVYNKMNQWKSSTGNIWTSYKNDIGKFGVLSVDANIVTFKLDNNTQFTKWVKANKPDTAFNQYMTGSDFDYKGTINIHKVFSKKFQVITGVDFEFIKSIPPYANDQLYGKSLKYEGSVAEYIDKNLTLEETRVAGFGQIVWSPLKEIDLVVGGRVDHSSRYGQTFNPRAGITVNPWEKTLIKFNYGTAFQAPSLFFQYEQWGSSQSVMLSTSEVKNLDPKWKLKNQLVRTYELSITQKIGKSFQIKVSAYKNYLTDLIQRVTFDTLNNSPNKYYGTKTKGIRNENIGKQTITGFNAELNYGISDKIDAYAYYCYTKGVSESSAGNVDIPRISAHKLWFGTSIYNLFGRLDVSPRIRFIGNINNSYKIYFPDGKQNGYTSFDLSMSVNRIFNYIKLYVLINNLLNQKIEHAGLFQQDPKSGYLPVVPQEGLRFNIGIEINFMK